MYISEFQFRKFVNEMFQSKREGPDGFLHAAAGLAGEASEVLDHCKKLWVYDREGDIEEVIEEMGDTLHYFFMLMIKLSEIGVEVTLSDIMQNNIDKLKKRYPNGFTKADAIARADKAVAA